MQPLIDEHSRALATHSQSLSSSPRSAPERLYLESTQRTHRKLQRTALATEAVSTDQAPSSSPPPPPLTDLDIELFIHRQLDWRRRRDQKLALMRSELQRDPQLFQPSLNPVSLQIAEHIDRRPVAEPLMMRSNQSPISDELEHCTFHPQIDPISRILAQRMNRPSLTEPVSTASNDTQHMIESEAIECTHQPQLNQVSLLIADRIDDRLRLDGRDDLLDAKIRMKREQRFAQWEEQKSQSELSELESCTFRPVIHTKPKSMQQPLTAFNISGLKQYMDKVQRARQLNEEQRQREIKAFALNAFGEDIAASTAPSHSDGRTKNRSTNRSRSASPASSKRPSTPRTVPRPFQFSFESGEHQQRMLAKQRQLQQEAEDRFNAEAPFKPQTPRVMVEERWDEISSVI